MRKSLKWVKLARVDWRLRVKVVKLLLCLATFLQPCFAQVLRTPQTEADSNKNIFDVVSVKPSRYDDAAPSGITTGHGRLNATYVTLKRCIVGAYELEPSMILGGPDWIDKERFDIDAVTDPTVNTDHEFMQKLQHVLEDRFGLRIHWETRPLDVFELKVDKKGSRLTRPTIAGIPKSGSTSTHGLITLQMDNANLDSFADRLSRRLNHAVINQTGLVGEFSINLTWSPDQRILDGDPDSTTVFKAIKDQLGLVLRPAKAPVKVLVIDRATQPSPN